MVDVTIILILRPAQVPGCIPTTPGRLACEAHFPKGQVNAIGVVVRTFRQRRLNPFLVLPLDIVPG